MKPENYVYEIPEDYVIHPKTREKLDAFVTKTNLTNAEAQKMVNLHVELVDEYAKLVEQYTKKQFIAVGAISSIITAAVFVTIILM